MLINHSWLDTSKFETEVNTLSFIFNTFNYSCPNKEASFLLNNRIKSRLAGHSYIRFDKYWYRRT